MYEFVNRRREQWDPTDCFLVRKPKLATVIEIYGALFMSQMWHAALFCFLYWDVMSVGGLGEMAPHEHDYLI